MSGSITSFTTSTRRTTDAIPAGIYARVSTPNQVGGRFDSCESQLAFCRDFLAKHSTTQGWYEAGNFTDPAYSGGNLKRPGMQALMRQIEAGAIKVVLIFKLERVLRSTNEWVPFRAFLKQHGCRLVSATEDISDETPSGRLKTNIVMSVSEYERDNTAEKIHLKLVEQAKRGMWTGGNVPYGYTYDPIKQTLHISPDEARVLRRIFEEAARLTPLSTIANRLTADGIKTRPRVLNRRDGTQQNIGQKRFRTDILRRLIMRPLYVGKVRMLGEEYPGQHEAIVSVDLWERANAAVARADEDPPCRFRTGDKHFHVLKGIAFCGCCRRAMIPSASGKRNVSGGFYRYYTCGRAHKERADANCPVRHVSANALESAVLEFLGQCSRHPDVITATADASQRRRLQERTPLRARVSAIDRTLADIVQQLRNCAQIVARTGVQALDDELRRQANELQQQKQTLLVEREQVRQDLDALESEVLGQDRIIRSLARFKELWPNLEREQRRELLMLFLARVDIRPDRNPGSGHTRYLQLRMKVRIGRLVQGMEDQVIIENRDSSAPPRTEFAPWIVDARVVLEPSGSVEIRSPFSWSSGGPARPRIKRLQSLGNPLQRAQAWQQRLNSEPGLTRLKIARDEGLSPGAITHYLKLLFLAPEIQKRLLQARTEDELRVFSLNRMKALADLEYDEQRRRFAKLCGELPSSA